MDRKITTIEEIKNHIENKNNFVLNGGAGSGKTRTLVEVIKLIYDKNENNKIACITFTNVAANEIKERVTNENINFRSSTIHDFLWENIKTYQKNLKHTLVHLIETKEIKYSGDQELNQEFFYNKEIKYHDWQKLDEGIISHNIVLKLANRLFKKYPLLRKILNDKFDFILIDEYQDTEKQVIEIFLNFFQQDINKPIIGLFGDAMQSIYESRIENVEDYKQDVISKIQKEDNWRCSKSVITLINKIRNDGLQQNPAGNQIEGKTIFLYSNKEVPLEKIKTHKKLKELFDFDNPKENKELYLTHRLIAKQFGFENLLSNYTYTEKLTGDNPDNLVKHLLKIQEIVYLYEEQHYNEFIKKTDFKLKKGSDKKLLKEKIEQLKNSSENKIEEVIDLANKLELVKKDDNFQNFIEENEEQYNKIKCLEFKEIERLFKHKNEFTHYSTQHGVKGKEFNNVLVILDNGNWNKFNFEYFFGGRVDKQSIIERTRKIFYVCCSIFSFNNFLSLPFLSLKSVFFINSL